MLQESHLQVLWLWIIKLVPHDFFFKIWAMKKDGFDKILTHTSLPHQTTEVVLGASPKDVNQTYQHTK